MSYSRKMVLIKTTIAGIATLLMIILLSLPLSIIPPLGALLLPGNGIWTIPQENPNWETLSLPSLVDDVSVYRDEWGVPHIYGTNEPDLMFALGYVHAQDRWFQMDLFRRIARGLLSEILGPASLKTDMFNLMKLQNHWANETVNFILANRDDPEIEAIYQALVAYSEGINTYLTLHPEDKPIEYYLIGAEPNNRLWKLIDTMVLVKFLSEYFTWGYGDFSRFQVMDALGAADYNELFGFPLPYQIPVVPSYGEYSDISLNASNPEKLKGREEYSVKSPPERLSDLVNSFMDRLAQLPMEAGRINEKLDLGYRGSNNWVVGSNKTATGNSMLAIDMHLGWTLPGMWYEAHLIDLSSDFNVYGVFLPGINFPAAGFTRYVAWGNTIAAYDLLDWYYYNGINETHYWYKGVATEFENIAIEIPVKGEPEPVKFVVNSTVHGPVFTGLIPIPDNYSENVLACRWVSQAVTMDFRAGYQFIHAHDISEFGDAIRYFEMLPLNVAYADVNGNIGMRPNAKVPIRNDTNLPTWHTGGGSMPYNGSLGQGEWLGFWPFEQRPQAENPKQGYLASANQVIAGPKYSNVSIINQGGADGYRARRINHLLSYDDSITVEDMITFQNDVYDVRAGNFTPYLLNTLKIRSLEGIQQAAYKVLDGWNFIMEKDAVAPTIFEIWFNIYHHMTFEDDMAAQGSPRTPSWPVLEKLTKENPSSKWFDDVNTPSIVETRNSIILKAFDKALELLQDYFGTDISTWTWGTLHQKKFSHLFELFLPIRAFSSGPFPGDGSRVTLSPSYTNNIDFANWILRPDSSLGGASERIIVDFSNMNKSLAVIPSGQRGITSSRHYNDQLLQLFLEGKYHDPYFLADTPTKIHNRAVRIEGTIVFRKSGE
ncbi:MAG: penicillin acylase family protein [Candidatus Thorarchaeota archaeon]